MIRLILTVCCLWAVLPRAVAVSFVGGFPAGTASPADGIGVGSDGLGYVFVTPRHFLYGHFSTPGSIEGIAVTSTTTISTGAAAGSNMGMHMGELASDLPGVTPLPLAGYSTNLNHYLNLPLRVFGRNGANYGIQNTGSQNIFSVRDDRTGSGTYSLGVVDVFDSLPNDRYLFVDMRPQASINGTGFLRFGDSNAALLANINGTWTAMGTALGFIDDENPRTGQMDADADVYNLAGYYKTTIDSWLAARSTALNATYAATYVALAPSGVLMVDSFQCVYPGMAPSALNLQLLSQQTSATTTITPEPTRILLLLVGITTALLRRRRSV